MGGNQHYHEYKIWQFFPICYGDFCPVRSYDGREDAEEHGKYEDRCNA